MRKFLSFCVLALFATASFSQYSIKMERMEADGQIYYQGELPLKSYVDDAEDGFLPALNTAYVVDLKNLTTNTQMGKLQVNIVDRAESNGWWTEVNPTYKVLGEDITPSDAITQEAKIFVKQLGEEPKEGKYTLIFHAWGVYENVDEVTLTIEDLSMATLVDMYLEETSLELSTGETSDVKSLVRYSLFEETETDKYPLFSSSNPKVVEIDENGVITAVAPGTATITITTLGKLLTAIDEYEAGSLLTRENELQVTVSLKPNVVFAWNSYGTDVEGVGEEGVSDYWQYSNTEKIPAALDAFESGLASTWTASEGDSFTIHIKGVSKVTGTLDLVLVDQRQEVNNWGEMSDFERSIAITEGEEFDITKTMEIKYFQNAQGVSYAMPDVVLEFSPSNGSEYGKENTVDFSLSEFNVSYEHKEVGGKTPTASFTEKSYTVEAGEKITITPAYTDIDDFSNLAFLLKEYNGCVTFEPQKDGSCVVTGVVAGKDSLILNLTYSDGTQTYKFNDTCEIVVTPSQKVPQPKVEKTKYVYCQNDVPEAFSVEADEGAKLQWYRKSKGDYVLLDAEPVIATDNVTNVTYAVSQVIDGVESAKVEISIRVNETPTLELVYPKIAYVDSPITIQANASISSYYVWSTGDEVVNPTTESKIQVSFAQIGVHNLFVEANAEGCKARQDFSIKTKPLPTVSFAKETYSVFVGETISVAPLFDNMIAGDDAQWTVADETIASVENQENGTIKAEGIGSTVVTYSTTYTDPETKYTQTYSASYTLQVTEFVESVVCENVEIEMFTGEHFFVDATVHSLTGENDYHLETSSQDSLKIDIVDKMITAVEAGEVVLNVVSDGKSSLRGTITVTIKPFISAKEISLPKQVTILVGSDTTLVASVIPANASYVDVTFLEKDDDIITVTADGKVVGKSVGTSIVSASTKEGLQGQTMVYVTSSDEEIVKIRLNNGEEAMYLKVGESKTVSCQVSPTTIKANDLVWASGNAEIATVSPSGIVTAEKEGEMFLYISYKTVIDEKIKVFVTKSNAPTISFIPTVAMQQLGSAVSLDLSSYVSDDVTEFGELQLSAQENENIAIEIQNGIATLTLKNTSFVGNTAITLVATDEEGLATSRSVDVQVAMKENEAPVVEMDTIVVPFGKYTQIVIADMVKDDYTASADLDFDFEEGENLIVKKMKNASLRISALEDDWFGEDYLTVTVTDADDLVTEKKIVVIVQQAENQAPVISEIPQQNEIGTELFSNIDLSQYVSDDYTSPSNIVWSATTSENVSVKFSGCYAEIADLNEYWRGAEIITFTAMDQGGLTSSIDVTFYRMTETTETEQEFGWYGKPTVKIITSRYYGTPGDEFTLIGTFYGSECSGEWIIDGVELSDPYALIQTLKFPETGFYDVAFKVMYGEGEILQVDENLVIYGIEQRNEGICIGSNATLTATDGVDSYAWSTNETTQSIEIAPETTQTYVLTMQKGLTTMIDSVTVRVSVPVSLREDSVMCAGTNYELVAQGEYESYSWNTGETTQSIVIPAAVADYTITTQDDLGCESSATFKVTAVNDLPTINLGDDKTVCDKVITTLDAGAGFVYTWDITKYDGSKVNSAEQSISLDSSAYVTVKIVDNNQCENFDTITVTYTYPYPEEIGIITYSESSKNLIVAWERTIDVNTVSYQVERKINDTQWEKVGDAVPFSDFGIVVDEATNFEGRAYNYRLLTTDGCNNTATSGVYRSSFIQSVKTQDGNYGVNWWTYKSPRQGNVVGSYLLRKTDPSLHADGLIEGYEVIDNFSSEDDFIGWTDTEGSLKPGDMVRVAFALDETVYENAVKDTDGNVVELQTKAESGPFSIAISNIAEVENTDAIESLFPADVAVYPTIVKDVINIALVAYDYNNFTIEVLDANGKVVAKTQTGDIVKAVVQIPASELSQGIYTVKLSADDAVKTVKVVK